MELLKKGTPLKTVYNVDMLQTIGMFEKFTHARVKDAFYIKETLTFIVMQGDKFKALGKELSNLKRMEQMLQKKIKIVEFDSDVVKFVSNLIHPFKVESIVHQEKTIVITDQDMKTKGLLIGAKAQNLRLYEGIVKKYFDIEEIRVI